MYRVLDESQDATVGIKIHEQFTREDYEGLLQYLQRLCQEVGRLDLFFDLTKFEREKSQGELSELIADLQETSAINRLAIIGDQRHWLVSSGEKGGESSRTEMKGFLPGQIDEAWRWLKGEHA